MPPCAVQPRTSVPGGCAAPRAVRKHARTTRPAFCAQAAGRQPVDARGPASPFSGLLRALGDTAVPAELTPVPVQPAAAEDVQAGKYEGPFGNGGPGSGGPWGGGGGGRGGRRGPNIAGVRRYDTMDAPPMGGGG